MTSSPSPPVIRYCSAYRRKQDGKTTLALMSKPYKPGHPWRFLLDYGFVDQGYELIYDTRAPEMLLIDFIHALDVQGSMVTGIRLARELFGPGPLLISKSAEPVSLEARFDGLDYIFSSRPDRGNNVCVGGMHLPQVITMMQHYNMGQWAWPNRTEKPRFCNFIYSHSGKHGGNPRESFCRDLMRYKHVDCPGKSLNNMQFPQTPPPYNADWHFEKLHLIKDYKFTIAFENQSFPGYITEKISHPLAVGSIPIYWGCKEAADYYNPKAFINCHDYPDFDAVIEHVREVDNNPQLYAEYINAPPTLPGQHYHEATMINKFRRIADEVYAEIKNRRVRL